MPNLFNSLYTRAMFAVRLLGRPRVFDGEVWISPPRGKAAALLFYLAYQRDWVTRDELIYLFWPDTQDKQARSNLRSLLTRAVKSLPYTGELEIERASLRWLVASDVSEFRNYLESGEVAAAVSSYKGNLLSPFTCGSIPEFDNWLELERQEMARLFQEAAEALIKLHEKQGDIAALTELRHHLYQLDPLEESKFQAYIKALIASGKLKKAEQEYEVFIQRLWKELDLEPDEATKALAEKITELLKVAPEGEIVETVTSKEVDETTSNTAKVVEGAPTNLSPFIGRKKEIRAITDRLKTECRLLSIVAPGGMGKTRLALEVAKPFLESFGDGVYFCSLVDVEKSSNIVFALAKSLGLGLQGNLDAHEQVIDHLRQKDVLLVLDNFEHLLDDLSFLLQLLSDCLNIKIIVTSRQVLNLRQEFVYELDGLGEVSNKTQAAIVQELDDLENEAIELFVKFTQRNSVDFKITEEHLTEINEICQLLGGMPLAIELAATWLRHLTISELQRELKSGFDILVVSEQDVPVRQQSLEAVFEQSWKRLRSVEQEALRKLAIFESSFTRQAAKEICGVSLPVIATLRDKAFLKLSSGRYSFHPLIHQFLKAKLNADQDLLNALLETCVAFYLSEVEEKMFQRNDSSAFEFERWIREEQANIQLAYKQLLKNDFLDTLVSSTHLIDNRGFVDMRGALHFYEACLHHLDDADPKQKWAKAKLGLQKLDTQHKLGQKEDLLEAKDVLETFEELGDTKGIVESLQVLGIIYRREGRARESTDFGYRAYRKALDYKASGGDIDPLKYKIYYDWFRYMDAQTYEEAREILENLNHELEESGAYPWHKSFNAKSLIKVNLAYQNYSEAARIINEECFLAEQRGFPLASDYPFSLAGYLAYVQGDYKEARESIQKARFIINTNQTYATKGIAITVLARVAIAEKEFDKAESLLKEIITKLWYDANHDLLLIFVVIAESRISQGKLEEAAKILLFCLERGEIDHLGREEAKRLLERLTPSFSDEQLATMEEEARALNFDSIIRMLD